MTNYQTVAEAIARNAEDFPERTFVFQDMNGIETACSFAEIERETAKRAFGLQALGLQKGDRMGVVVVEPRDFVLTFLAALRIGVLPVPLYPPLSFGSLDSYADRTATILGSCKARVIVASESLQNILWGLVGRAHGLEKVIKAEDVAKAEGSPRYPTILPQDLAFLQYTSGSTADPKGVMVTHGNLTANCMAIRERMDIVPERGDKAVSWLPLYHDMGLIGFVLTPVLTAVPTVFIPTLRFIKRPTVWFDALHNHKANMTFGPNFAYALITKRAKPEDKKRWDLSRMTVFGCGAEPIHPGTVREFLATFAECGVKPESFLPAYGMAEATLAMAFKAMYTAPVMNTVDSEQFQQNGVVVEPSEGEPTFEHVSCGAVFAGHQFKIRAEDGSTLPEGMEGEICLFGPSVTPGYWDNPAATSACITEGWLRTGDLGYLRDGEIYVTGRLKDLIILNGRNIHPQAVEWAATVEGVRKGNVVAFSRPGAHSEELVVALETKEQETKALEAAVKLAVQKELGLTVAEVVCLEPGQLPKTSSGKLQRRKTRQQYLTGDLVSEGSRLPGTAANTLTLAKHVARSVWSRAKAAIQL